MTKWSLFFLLVPVIGVGVFAVAGSYGWDLPQNVSTLGRDIDHLYYVILAITGVVFIVTNLVLCYILMRFNANRPAGASYTHGSRKLEIAWTIVPAAVLLFISLYQLPAWVQYRFPQSKPDIPINARVIARQFEWMVVYPGPDRMLDTVDDVYVHNELHIPMGRRVLIELRSMDVLHSFFLPHLRVKQDAVPGLTIPLWFDANQSSRAFQNLHASLTAADCYDLGAVAVALKTPKRQLDKVLLESLREETQSLLAAYDGKRKLAAGDPLFDALLADLNYVINSNLPEDNLDHPALVEQLTLSKETLAHQQAGPGGRYAALMNRQILTDAFGSALRPINFHYDLVCAELCGWGHYKMKGRLVVHETQEEYDGWLAERYNEQEASR